MRYAIARYNENQRELAYRIYLTDTLYFITRRQGMAKRFRDIIVKTPDDERSGEEIAAEVIARAGLVVNDGYIQPTSEN